MSLTPGPSTSITTSANGGSTQRSAGLPKTIEEATRRYLVNYQGNFKGPASEMARLRDIAEAKIYRLRKKQPKFFEEKLPVLVNQACSELLTCNTSTVEGAKKFHHTHKHFLRVLDEFWRSVPGGAVNFQTEKERSVLRDKLCQKQLELRTKIDELEANEIDIDELGDEDAETLYTKTFAETDRLKAELHTVSIQIAALENESIEEEIEFELKVPRSSILRRLSKQQLQKLENIMFEFVKENKAQKNAMYVDKSIVDGMISRLDIDQNLFTKEELHDMSRDALDGYKQYFREKDCERRNILYESLLKNKSLMPKEGIIFEGPDDISDEVREELDQTDKRYKRKIEEWFEEYAKKPCPDESQADDVEEEVAPQDTCEILASVIKSNPIFAQTRIKEEPRDDYDYDLPSDDEVEVPEEMADALAHEDIIECADENNVFTERESSQPRDDDDDMIVSSDTSQNHNGTNTVDVIPPIENASSSESYHSTTEGSRLAITNGHSNVNGCGNGSDISDLQADDDDDDDDIEFVGIVEPTDKVKHVNLT